MKVSIPAPRCSSRAAGGLGEAVLGTPVPLMLGRGLGTLAMSPRTGQAGLTQAGVTQAGDAALPSTCQILVLFLQVGAGLSRWICRCPLSLSPPLFSELRALRARCVHCVPSTAQPGGSIAEWLRTTAGAAANGTRINALSHQCLFYCRSH